MSGGVMTPPAPSPSIQQIVEYLDHPKLKNFVKKFSAGSYLFKQGDMGNTMYIIVDGTIWLVSEKEGQPDHVAAVLERGQFIGERAVMGFNAHRRFFSAKAKTQIIVIELGLKDIDMIQQTAPDLMIDMLRRMFLVAADRLDRANHLMRLLRSSDNVDRLVELIVYFSDLSGRKVPEGTEFILTLDSLQYHVDMPPEHIEECIAELVRKKILKKSINDYYVLKDPKAVIAFAPHLRQQLAHLRGGQPAAKSGGFSFFKRR